MQTDFQDSPDGNLVKTGRKLRWERISSYSMNLQLLNSEDLDRRRVEKLLDLIDTEQHRKVQLKQEARTDLRRWFRKPDSPLNSSTYVLVSNWFLTGGGDRSSDLARLCEELWDELFACRPTERLSSSAPGENHKIIPERFESFYKDLQSAQSGTGAEMQQSSDFDPEPMKDNNEEEYSTLAWHTHLSTSFCAELVSLLLSKKQIILEGTPGSGKTFVAEHLGRFLTFGADGYAAWTKNREAIEDSLRQRFEIVQFHESYGYEDFVQGFRPSTVDGSMVFERRDGIFVEFCARARENSGSYVVLIDEINRGKPSKIFGELLYLLEYRGKSIKLSSGQSFTIPDNALIVGTMNTADKSIALVDYALRRRFCFVALRPVEDGRAPVLASWLERNNIQNRNDILKLFLNLNSKIRDKFGHDLQVGHSYFMDKDLSPGSLFPQALLESIWRYNILPLVQEYGYSKAPEEIEREFGLNLLRNYGS